MRLPIMQLNNNTHLEKGLEWADFAISGNFIGVKNFTTLSTKANILLALERNDEALVVIEEAIPSGLANQLHVLGRALISRVSRTRLWTSLSRIMK